MEDLAEDINVIDKKLAELKNMQIDSVDLVKETYNPAHLIAHRDIEKNLFQMVKCIRKCY